MLRAAQTPPTLITLIVGTALSVLSLNMFLPSLPGIAKEFQVDYGLANLSVAGYLAISAALQIVMGPMSDLYGRRKVMLLCCAMFVLASVGCALASNIWVFLGFRLLQGAIISGQVISRAVVRDMYPPSEAASKLGYMGMIMALAPMAGPMIGGALDMAFGWRASFVLYTGFGLALLALVWTDFGETNQTRAATIAQKGFAAGIDCWQVDGNDAIAVHDVVGRALEKARDGGGPALVEALTYRLTDHTTADDAGRYRDDAEVSDRWQKDPVPRLRNFLVNAGAWNKPQEEKLLEEINTAVEASVNAYEATPPMPPSSMFEHLYAELPAAYHAQVKAVAALAGEDGDD